MASKDSETIELALSEGNLQLMAQLSAMFGISEHAVIRMSLVMLSGVAQAYFQRGRVRYEKQSLDMFFLQFRGT